MTVPLSIALAELRSPLENSYRNAFYCASDLEQDEEGVIRGHFCGTRWCLVCNRVRTARAINNYYPMLRTWVAPQFVTLTIPNVGADELDGTIAAMLWGTRLIASAIRRTDRLPFRALRKLECTFNLGADTFHPHLHLVVETKASADALVRRWLQRHPEASPKAQDARKCDERSMMELFKYFTKLLTKRSDDRSSRAVAPVEKLDVIFLAMKGRRVFQPMGFPVAAPSPQDDEAEIGTSGDTLAAKRLGDRVYWEWVQNVHDWIDLSSGEVLTGYEPTDGQCKMLRSIEIRS